MEEQKQLPEQPIEEQIANAILERPITFSLYEGKKTRFFYIYPPSLGISFVVAPLLKELHIDKQLLFMNPQYEMLRLCTEHRDIVLRFLAIHTFQRRSDAIREEKIQERMRDLSAMEAWEISPLLTAIMTWQGYEEKFIKHYGIDEERKTREKIRAIKEEDGSTFTFGGNSIYGSVLDSACERYGWELGYILWGISLLNLNMMLADSVTSTFLTEEERKKAHVSTKGSIIKADDPKNAALVKAFFDNIK